MIDCSKITQGFIVEDCNGPATAGTAGRIVLISKSDINYGLSPMVDGVLTKIILKPGAKGYAVESLPNAIEGDAPANVGAYTTTFQHTLVVRIFKKSEAAKKFVNQLSMANVVAIVENNERGTDGEVKYEVYGWNSGMKLTDLTAATAMADGVAYQIGLGSGEVAQEKGLPISFYNTDEATTDEAVEALLTVAPAP